MSSSRETSNYAAELEHLRRRLLDLTGRNRLLNYRHPKARSLRFIDTDPHWLVDELLSGRSVRIDYIPSPPRGTALQSVWPEWVARNGSDQRPSARDWAAHEGYDTEFDLRSHCGRGGNRGRGRRTTCAQASHYPEELESLLNKIHQNARTAIEDSGANILYLAVGFLSWSDRDDASQSIAPLYLVPVTLESKGYDKDTRRKIYTITHNGEDIQENLSLREKLKRQLNLSLPALEDDDSVSSYLKKCERLLQAKPSWKVSYFATLGFFQFGKLLLYLDLDPERWPWSTPLTSHPVIAKVLGGGSSDEGSFEYAEPISPDELPVDVPEFKLVQSADSSQHSVIVDAAKGKNLVVEGPPGTGKSQTITNIIAVALMKGQSVLFVSEKMAALEVVRRRLDSVGLGDFCLELHSHRTQRKKLLADIEKRINRGRGQFSQRELKPAIEKYNNLRKWLNDYAALINDRVPGYLFSLHSLIWEVAQLRSGGTADVDLARLGPSDEHFTQESYDDALYDLNVSLRRRRHIAAEVRDLCNHPLFGLVFAPAEIGAWRELAEMLRIMADHYGRLNRAVAQVQPLTEVVVPTSLSGLVEVARLVEGVRAPGELATAIRLRTLLADKAHAQDFRSFVSREKDYKKVREGAEGFWKADILDDPGTLTDTLRVIGKLGAGRLPAAKYNLDQLRKMSEIAGALGSVFASAEPGFRALNQCIPLGAWPAGSCGLVATSELLTILSAVPLDALSFRSNALEIVGDDTILARMETNQAHLNDQLGRLSLRFDMSRVQRDNTLRVAAEYLQRKSLIAGQFDAEWRAANKRYKSLCTSKPLLRSAKKRAADIRDLADYCDGVFQFENDSEYVGMLGGAFSGMETPAPSYRKLVSWNNQVKAWASRWFENPLRVARIVMRLTSSQLEQIRAIETDGMLKDLQQAVWQLQRLNQLCDERLGTDWFGSWESGAKAAHSVFENLDHSLELLTKYFNSADVVPATAFRAATPYVELLLDQKRAEGRERYVRMGHGLVPYDATKLARLEDAVALSNTFWQDDSSEYVRELLRHAHSDEALSELLARLVGVLDALQGYREQCPDLLTKLGATHEFFSAPVENVDVRAAATRCKRALDGEETFPDWAELLAGLSPKTDTGLPWRELKEEIVTDRLSDEEAQATLTLGVLTSILDSLMQGNAVLKEFEGLAHEELRSRLREVDNKLLALHQLEVAHKAASRRPPEGTTGARVADLSEMHLLRREISKTRKHVPIRRLVNRAGRALKALKPCFMMGPLSVAQYLEPGKIEFDLVVMDEASQMKPEDALGAIARARQVIVVGDPKQLPPTSFFDRIDDDLPDEEDDQFVGAGSESILDLLIPTLGRVRQLNWHYRSRHESLIAFCNRQFYDDRLLAFPSPRRQALYGTLGISYHPVNGEYGQQRNFREAEDLLRGVLREVRSSGGTRTVGVVAINSQQAELLNENWLRLVREHPDIEPLIEKWAAQDEPFFIKNLENVQGDERDVIFISLTYGPNSAGHVYQRFGPINQQNGWRRLNVLFSRARQNMVVYSSMRSYQVTPAAGSAGAMALKQFLEYCERGGQFGVPAEDTGREPDSPFEVEVIGELQRQGFECMPQVGVAGFFIDIGIKDPESPGDYLLGVECDGASYHSAKSARDRDYLRQSILEGLGWSIHRIWSPDWHKRRDREVSRLVRAVEIARQKARREREARRLSETVPVYIGPEENVGTLEASQDVGVLDGQVREPTIRTRILSDGPSDLRSSLKALRETIDSEFPDVSAERHLLGDEVIELLVEKMPACREEFAVAIPGYIRQQIDVEQAKQYLGTVLSICEQYA